MRPPTAIWWPRWRSSLRAWARSTSASPGVEYCVIAGLRAIVTLVGAGRPAGRWVVPHKVPAHLHEILRTLG